MDLNNHLFEQMERLNDDDLLGEKLAEEISRSESMGRLALVIIGNAKLALDAHKAINEGLINTAPEIFGMKQAKQIEE